MLQSKNVNTPATIGIIKILYENAQNKFIFINIELFLINLKIATILNKFSEIIIISAAFRFNSLLAFILTPIYAYCKESISFKP
jgi:hypothetical protein